MQNVIDLIPLDVTEKANAGVVMQAKHPISGEPIGLFISLLGRDSTEFKRVLAKQNRARLKKMSKGNKLKIDAISESELEADGIEALAVATMGFFEDEACTKPATILVKKDIPALGFSFENCKIIYTHATWLREQVDEVVAERADFFQQSSSN